MNASIVGLLLGLVVSSLPFAYSLRRDRAGVGCAGSLFTAIAVPFIWFGPASSIYIDVLPDQWTACDSPLSIPLALLITPVVVLAVTVVPLLAIRWSAGHEGK